MRVENLNSIESFLSGNMFTTLSSQVFCCWVEYFDGNVISLHVDISFKNFLSRVDGKFASYNNTNSVDNSG